MFVWPIGFFSGCEPMDEVFIYGHGCVRPRRVLGDLPRDEPRASPRPWPRLQERKMWCYFERVFMVPFFFRVKLCFRWYLVDVLALYTLTALLPFFLVWSSCRFKSGRLTCKYVVMLWTRSATRLSLGRPPSAPSLTASAPLTSTPPRLPRRPRSERFRFYLLEIFDAYGKRLEVRGRGSCAHRCTFLAAGRQKEWLR